MYLENYLPHILFKNGNESSTQFLCSKIEYNTFYNINVAIFYLKELRFEIKKINVFGKTPKLYIYFGDGIQYCFIGLINFNFQNRKDIRKELLSSLKENILCVKDKKLKTKVFKAIDILEDLWGEKKI